MSWVKRGQWRHTFPTKSWVRVSRRGLSRDGWEEVAILMTASMSSFVGVNREGSGVVEVWGGEGCVGEGEYGGGRGGEKDTHGRGHWMAERKRRTGFMYTDAPQRQKQGAPPPRHLYVRRHSPLIMAPHPHRSSSPSPTLTGPRAPSPRRSHPSLSLP